MSKSILFLFTKTIQKVNKSISGQPICRHFSSAKPNEKQTANKQQNEKLIKVAIVGVPNAGKSTFINNLINHRVSNQSKFFNHILIWGYVIRFVPHLEKCIQPERLVKQYVLKIMYK